MHAHVYIQADSCLPDTEQQAELPIDTNIVQELNRMDDILADQCAMEDAQLVPSGEEKTTDNG